VEVAERYLLGIGLKKVLDRVTKQFFVNGDCTTIARPRGDRAADRSGQTRSRWSGGKGHWA
jgi:hypothetical protein